MANPFFGAGERVEINGNAAKIHSFDAVAAVILYDVRIPVHRDRPFRFIVTADSGAS